MLNAGRDQVANHQNGCAGPLGTRTPDATELRRQSANETLLRPPKASHPIAFDREIAQSGEHLNKSVKFGRQVTLILFREFGCSAARRNACGPAASRVCNRPKGSASGHLGRIAQSGMFSRLRRLNANGDIEI